jgi:heme oxygenase
MNEASRVFEFTSAIFGALNLEKEESKVVYDEDASTGSKTYSLASVLAVITAGAWLVLIPSAHSISRYYLVCAAHFLLTLGGFTGERGWEKLVAVEDWISTKLNN